jgi:hypothetical protein
MNYTPNEYKKAKRLVNIICGSLLGASFGILTATNFFGCQIGNGVKNIGNHLDSVICKYPMDDTAARLLRNPATGDYIISISRKEWSYYVSADGKRERPTAYFGVNWISHDTTNNGNGYVQHAFRFKDSCTAKSIYDEWYRRKLEIERLVELQEQKNRIRDSLDSLKNIFIPVTLK